MSLRDTLSEIGRAALAGAQSKFPEGKEFAVVVIVRPVDADVQHITTNVKSGPMTVGLVIQDALNFVHRTGGT